VKVLVDADSERFLGVAALGVRGDEVVAPFAVAMTAGISWRTFRRTVLSHPTIAEMLPWTLDELEPVTREADA
jgi:pyruvate/2-oxoglutarate dehydrogenase complex dihydrolipoamide dehydrogenase (E3) component